MMWNPIKMNDAQDVVSILSPVSRVDLLRRGSNYTLVTHRGADVTIQGLGNDLRYALEVWHQAAGVTAKDCKN